MKRYFKYLWYDIRIGWKTFQLARLNTKQRLLEIDTFKKLYKTL